MIRLIDQSGKLLEFEDVDVALAFLWGKDVGGYRVLLPLMIPEGYLQAKEFLGSADVQNSLPDQPELDLAHSNEPQIPPQVEPEAEEEQASSIAGNMSPIGIGFEVGPKR